MLLLPAMPPANILPPLVRVTSNTSPIHARFTYGTRKSRLKESDATCSTPGLLGRTPSPGPVRSFDDNKLHQ
jgi:hypothetical protein